MVQTVKTIGVQPQEKIIIAEKPHTLQRVFFRIDVATQPDSWYPAKVSFNDPLFLSYFRLVGTVRSFEMTGNDIFQGDIWVKNESTIILYFSSTEILR